MKTFRTIFLLLFLFFSNYLFAQIKFSLATDISLLHNFDGTQKFTVVGQTLIPQWHFDKKTTVVASFSYHGYGKYESTLLATAKSPGTQPQSFTFTSQSQMRLRQLSLGIKKYI